MMCKSEVLSMNAVIYARYSNDNQREEYGVQRGQALIPVAFL